MHPWLHWLRQQRRKLLWASGTLCLYSLLGFLVLPWFAGRQLGDLLERRLALDLQLSALRFNPFNFTLEAEQLRLHAADGPLLELDRLYVNLEPWRLFMLQVRVAELVIDSPRLYFSRYSATDDSFSRLAQQWTATATPDESPEPVIEEASDSEPFPLELLHFEYNNGSIHYRDEVPATPFQTTIAPINIGTDNLSLREAKQEGRKQLLMQLEDGGTLSWHSTFTVTPLNISGQLRLADFNLGIPYRYLADSLPFVLDSGSLALEFDFNFGMPDGPRLVLSNLGLRINDVAITDTASGEGLLADAALALEGGSFVYPDMNAQADALRIDGLRVNLQRDRAGELNWLSMLARLPQSAPEPDPEPAEPAIPLQLHIAEARIDNTQLSFTDQTLQSPATLTLHTQARLEDFSLAPDTRMPLATQVRLASGGVIDVAGELQLLPALNLDAELELTELALQAAQPWLDEVAHLDIDSGNLSLRARVHSGNSEPFSWQGGATIADLQLTDRQRDETLLSLTTLQLDTMDFTLAERSLAISELDIDGLFARVMIDENGQTNIAQVLVTTDEPEPAEDTALTVSLGRLKLTNAGSDFTDRNLPIVFDTRMRNLQGEISGFSTGSSEAMKVSLEGQVGNFGLAEISGTLNPLNMAQQTDIKLAFNNLELPSMTPYVIKFAGREIAEGRVDVNLEYTINDNALQANNAVIIRDMRLGARVDYPDAMRLPLDLAVALLKNRDGVIDLRVPVTGSLDDPQFKLGPVIRQAISNVLTNIVTAPFRLLGALVGGDTEELDSIRFRPGRSDLAPPEQEKLQKLVGALQQRPQLALELPAPYVTNADTLALQSSAVDARIETLLAEQPEELQLLQRRQQVLEQMYTEAALEPLPESMLPVEDVLAYSAQLRERLIAAEIVTTGQLQALAVARQRAIADYLLATGALSADRLVLQATEEVPGMDDDNWLSAKLDVGVAD